MQILRNFLKAGSTDRYEHTIPNRALWVDSACGGELEYNVLCVLTINLSSFFHMHTSLAQNKIMKIRDVTCQEGGLTKSLFLGLSFCLVQQQHRFEQLCL